jgi:hypothetical protein
MGFGRELSDVRLWKSHYLHLPSTPRHVEAHSAIAVLEYGGGFVWRPEDYFA